MRINLLAFIYKIRKKDEFLVGTRVCLLKGDGSGVCMSQQTQAALSCYSNSYLQELLPHRSSQGWVPRGALGALES